jgi:adenine deaminase
MQISGKVVDPHVRRVYGAVVVFEEGRIVSVSECDDVPDVFIMPGFVDAHVHIESSMATPGAFAVAAVPHGTVEVVSDPHEIANVLGLAGVHFMMDDAESVPMRFSFGAPSCVPATPFESSGARLGIEEVSSLLADSRVKFLSEMMNFPGVVNSSSDVVSKLQAAARYGKPVDGHAPSLAGEMLKRYVDAGISTDHECTTIEEAREKIALGMKILIREGSAARNLEELHPLVAECPEQVMLCCDDIHPDDLAERHIDSIVRTLVANGYDIFDIITAATINPVNHYRLETGLLRCGDSADFIVVDNLTDLNVLQTWVAGIKIGENGHPLFKYRGSAPVNNFNCSMITADDIRTRLAGARIRVIEAFDGQLFTRCKMVDVAADNSDGYDIDGDILKIVVKERYRDGKAVTGFIKGFGIKKGAFASSVAHDSHNIVAVGTDDESICRAVNMVIAMRGGLSWSADGQAFALPLNIAGIMSSETVSDTAARYKALTRAVTEAGSKLQSPFMTLSFMALLVIPELKIGDRGLFDVTLFKEVPLIVEPDK